MRYNACVPDYTYTVIFEPNEAGGYTVSVPALPGLATFTSGRMAVSPHTSIFQITECSAR